MLMNLGTIVITSNHDCYIIKEKCTQPNKRRLDLQKIEFEPYVDQIFKGYGCERYQKYIEQNTGDLNAIILYFRAGVQSDNE